PVGAALVDEGLADLVAPVSERDSAAGVPSMARGGTVPLPRGRLRLYTHWAERAEPVDLDLAVAVYDESWAFVGVCDYTRLRLGSGAAVHSGDLASGTAPLGGTEFVDLDQRELRMLGGRYAVPVVLSHRGIPFDRLGRAETGLMVAPARLFDPQAVEHWSVLTGRGTVFVPFVIDLWRRRMRRADLSLPVAGDRLNVHTLSLRLGRLAQAFEDVHGTAGRVTLFELACWHAGGRSAAVTVRRRDGRLAHYAKAAGEDPAAFTARL
ncbi:TerD family protein, partial [Actinocorallia lasiicapitis]